tara:strand:- start:894 stop:2939 length:2046 start_codon:yes stop_codon:yes gene_type:complete
MKNKLYFQELDSLRALAVIFVIIFHAELKIYNHIFLSGGFIGVDIFFVLSGYLIGKIIYEDLYLKKFNLIRFFERRARRIVPNLLFVIMFSFLGAWLLLDQASYINFLKSLLSAISFFSNNYFWNISQSYNAGNSLFIPLLHTWSLSVEAQFYLLFPLVLIFLTIFTKRYFLTYLFIIASLSFIYSIVKEYNISFSYFYSSASRAWEFLFGFITYLVSKKKFDFKILTNEFLVFMGIILIIIPSLVLNKYTKFMPIYLLFPIFGTSLIILFIRKTIFFKKIFKFKPFVFIGLISYSLYLWHFPFFAFARISGLFSNNILLQASLVLIIFILSILSFYFIEKPFRNFSKINKISFFSIILVSTLLITSISFYIIKNNKLNYLSNKYPQLKNVSIFKDKVENEFNDLSKKCSKNKYYKDDNCYYFLPSNKVKNTIYLIGDSHKHAIKKDLIINLISKRFEVQDFVGDVYSEEVFYLKDGKILNNRTKDHLRNYQSILEVKNKIFIYNQFLIGDLASNSFRDLNFKSDTKILNKEKKILDYNERKDLLFKEITMIFNKILSNDNYLFIIYPWPEMKINIPNELSKNIYKDIFNLNMLEEEKFFVDYEKFLERQKEVIHFYDTFNNDKIIKIKPYKIFCNNTKKEKCISYDDFGVLYSDHYHLNEYGSTFINKMIINEIVKIKNY